MDNFANLSFIEIVSTVFSFPFVLAKCASKHRTELGFNFEIKVIADFPIKSKYACERQFVIC